MRVAVLSDHEARGGAATAASRLVDGLTRAGHEVWRLVLHSDGAAASRVRLLQPRTGLQRRLTEVPLVRRLARGALAGRVLRDALAEIRPDVINVHNLHGGAHAGWSVELVSICLDHASTVWTLHDLWSFTGRCVYPGACARFLTGCDAACPTPEEYPSLSPPKIAGAWRARQDLLRSGRGVLTAVSPTRWLAAQATAGGWRHRPVEVIPYGLPLDRFVPIDRGTARAALRLAPAGRVLLAAAADLSDRRKGLDLLEAALALVRGRPLTLLLMGAGRPRVEVDGVDVVDLGHTGGAALQSIVYSAADLYVHPAREDNLPNTVLEALACGTPTLGVSTGGVPEAVRPGQTGWLAGEPSPGALAATLDQALAELDARDWRADCRRVAEAEYDDGLQAARYARLFEALRRR